MASLRPEILVHPGGFPVTNTLVSTILVDVVLIALVFIVAKRISLVPSGVQSVFEPIIEYFYDLATQIAGSKVKTIFPWFASFFFFIVFANLIALLPGFGTIGFFENIEEHGKTTRVLIPLFRAATSDFNVTLALGTVSIVVTHIIAIRYNGVLGYIKKFLSVNPIYLFIGILEFGLELVKIFSLSFRLFGNIFAGEVVLATVAGLFAFIAPIPFLLLETIVAVVQALVFAMLTMVFMSLLATTSSEGGGH
jgi:F-type H+-transporting ATPase subunit a